MNYDGMILWFTGLPGAGKTTVATKVCKRLKAEGATVQLLDGDVIRSLNNDRIGFSREDRTTHMMQVGNAAKIIKDLGVICIVALISPYREVRRAVLEKIGGIEIFVDAPLEVCKTRDPKGLYARALRGEIKNFTGIDDPYEPPLAPQIHLHTDRESAEESSDQVYQFLQVRGLIDEQAESLNGTYQANALEKIVSHFPFASLLLLKRNGLTGTGVACFVDDCCQFLRVRQYPYKHRVVFVAGLPKSGTTWMKKLLSMVPGYHDRTIYDPSRLIVSHDISPMVFDLLPSYSHSIVKLHTRYSPTNFEIIRRYTDKFIVMYRDLRDMCISRYYHIINEELHRHHYLYKSLPKEEGITHSINIVRMEYVKWMRDWHRIAQRHSDIIMQVRYEDIHADLMSTMRKVLSFFDISVNSDLLEKMAVTQLQKPVDLKKSLSQGDTRRKGVVGDWQHEFSSEHRKYFKEIAGDLLIQLGYERDENW